MKRLLIILSFTFIITAANSQNDTINLEFDFVRELTELNDSNKGEGYPWISNDGLRIYFSKSASSRTKNYYSKRESIDDLFSNPEELTTNLSSANNFSPWLTDDELTIYFVRTIPNDFNSTKLYRATRNSIDLEFEAPIEVTLEFGNEGFNSSPSFTEDLEQLFIFHDNTTGNRSIRHFEKLDNHNYSFVDSISIPEGYSPCPGKLSKNGLKYYFALERDSDLLNSLYVAKRDNLESTFDSFCYIDNEDINNLEHRDIQPFMTKDRRFFVFIRASENSWAQNDLFIGYNSQPVSVKEYEFNENFKIAVSPNPATDFIKIEIVSNNQVYKRVDMIIYSSDGRVVDNIIFENQKPNHYLSTVEYGSGIYFFNAHSDEGDFTSGSFMVNK